MANIILTIEVSSDSEDSADAQVIRRRLQTSYNDSVHNHSDEPVAGPSGISKRRKQDGASTESSSTQLNPKAAKAAKKLKEAQEKAAKKNAEEIRKIYKPGECMKYINVEGHPSLWSLWWCSDVSREVAAAGARVVPSAQICHPSLVMWTRRVPRTLDKGSGQLKLTSSEERCNRALYVTSAEDVAELVHARMLAQHMFDIHALADCAITLVVFGLKDYFKSSRRKTLNSNRNPMSKREFELGITDTLVAAECDTATVNTPNELALLIVQFTKALAEAPYKNSLRAADDQAQFYMRGDNKNCIAMDKDGVAAGNLWQQMMAVLPNSSLVKSRALCGQYKTPMALYEELMSTDSVNKVADIRVSRAAAPGSNARRIGPEFSKKLSILFTADDGNTIVE